MAVLCISPSSILADPLIEIPSELQRLSRGAVASTNSSHRRRVGRWVARAFPTGNHTGGERDVLHS